MQTTITKEVLGAIRVSIDACRGEIHSINCDKDTQEALNSGGYLATIIQERIESLHNSIDILTGFAGRVDDKLDNKN